MSDRRLRLILRWSHLLFGSGIAIYLWSPLHENARATQIAQLALIPFLLLTGFGMWQQWGNMRIVDDETRD